MKVSLFAECAARAHIDWSFIKHIKMVQSYICIDRFIISNLSR